MGNLIRRIFKKETVLQNESIEALDTYFVFIDFQPVSYNSTVYIGNKKYELKGFVNKMGVIDFYLYDKNGKQLIKTFINANIEMPYLDKPYFKLSIKLIQKLEKEVSGKNNLGFIMMNALLKLVRSFERQNNLELLLISGILGNNTNFKPKDAIKLYFKFDNYLYDDEKQRYLSLDKSTCNTQDCNIEYLIIKKA